MHFEEGVLSAAFGEYAEYRKTVGALWPRGHGDTCAPGAATPSRGARVPGFETNSGNW
jgi:hypothetical protein